MFLADFRNIYVRVVRELNADENLIPTLEEVAAGRLYTGPAFTPLNNFLRLVGGVDSREWRAQFAQQAQSTYSSTAFHLVNLIRKGSKIASLKRRQEIRRATGAGNEDTCEELLLYRSLGGKLPDSFFVPDVQGMICAVDTGFSSASKVRAESVKFMKSNANQPCVLWVLHCAHEANSAGQLQIGHELTDISQFPGQAEILLPPLSMFQVLKDGSGKFMIVDKTETLDDGTKVAYKEIHVRPLFV